jgi:hypothetical protein
VAYPVACLPQAWAAGSAFMLVQACLGVEIDGIRNKVRIVQPRLPANIEQLRVERLKVGQGLVDLRFQRIGNRIVVSAESPPRGPHVEVELCL